MHAIIYILKYPRVCMQVVGMPARTAPWSLNFYLIFSLMPVSGLHFS